MNHFMKSQRFLSILKREVASVLLIPLLSCFITQLYGQVSISLVNKVEPTCNTYTNGSITVEALGGSAPYTYRWNNNVIGSTLSGISGGDYTVVATDASGVTGTMTVNLINPTPITSSISFANVCEGGSVTATGSGGTGPYTYNWGNGRTGATQIGIAGSNHNLTVTDSRGCIASKFVSVPNAFSVTLRMGTLQCYGDCDAAIEALAVGGTSPYTYRWNTGATTQSIIGLPSGTYNVTVTDANGCTATANGTIGNPLQITVVPSIVPPSCGGAAAGTAVATATGGRPPFTYRWSNGQTGANATGLSIGDYYVTVTDAGGCNRTVKIVVPSNSGFAVDINPVNAGCGLTNGSAMVNMRGGGTPPFSYLWSTGATTASLTGIGAGTYTVTITDANGCSNVATTTVNAAGSLTVGVTGADAACGIANGTVTATPTLGTAPFIYRWNTGATVPSLSLLGAGTYTVTVTDANGCTAIGSKTLIQTNSFDVSLDPKNVSCFGGTDGAISAMVMGGSAPYTYSWSNGGNVAVLANLAAGSYTVTVTDASGCSATKTVVITQPTALNVTTSMTQATCGNNNGSASVVVTGGTLPYTYLWSNGGTTSSISNIGAGVYTLVITDANRCKSVGTITVGSSGNITLSMGSTNVSCNGGNNGSASTSVTGATGTPTYSWSNGATSAMITDLAQGTYTVTVTNGGCTATGTVTITEPTAIAITLSATNPVCEGSNGSLTASASGGTPQYSYSWSNGATTASVSGLTAGTYILTVRDANNCIKTASQTLIAVPLPTATISGTSATCFGSSTGTATVSAANGVGPYSYNWNNNRTTATITGLAAGTYTVTVTDANGCNVIKSVLITEPSALAATTSSTNVLCNGGSTGTATVSVTGGTAPYSYNWGSNRTTATITGLFASTYTVTITDANGCTTTKSVTISEPTALSTTPSATNVLCFGGNSGTASVSVIGGTAPYSYNWSNNQTTAAITGLTAGTHTVTVTDANGCTTTQAVTLTQPSVLSATSSATNALCYSGNTGTATVLGVGGTAPYTYNWGNGRTTSAITGLTIGIYTATVTDANGCTVTKSVTVTEPSLLSTTVSGTNVLCNSGNTGTALAAASGGTAPYSYNWGSGRTTASVAGLTAGNYTVTVTDANGCTATKPITITEPSALTITGTITNATCKPIGAISIAVTGGTGGFTYVWSNGQTTSNISALSGGNYTVTVTDANGCMNFKMFAVPSVTSPNLQCTITQTRLMSSFNTNDAQARVEGSMGTPPYTYLWSTGATTQSAYYLSIGTKTVTVTDALGCVSTCNINIPQSPCNNLTGAGTICCSQTYCSRSELQQINETSPVSGGAATEPIEYLWMYSTTETTFNSASWLSIAGATGKDLPVNLIPTSDGPMHIIRCVRRAKCEEYIESNLITLTPRAFAIILGGRSVCINGDFAYQAVENVAGATYSWSFTGANITSSSNRVQSVRFTSLGQKEVRLTVNALGCSKTTVINVDVITCLGSYGTFEGFSVNSIAQKEVMVDWATANELVESRYWVEKSADGINFNKIGEVASQNNPNNLYHFADTEPKMGRSFYRVRQVNSESKELNKTNTKKILVGEDGQSVLAYPNPTQSSIFVEILDTDNAEGTIEVYNHIGKLIQNQPFTRNQVRYQVNIENLSTGTYILKIRRDDGTIKSVKINKL